MKKRLLIKIGEGIIITTFLFGCASMSSLQTVRTTEQGELAYSGGFGYIKTTMETSNDTIYIATPILELAGSYGISEKLDIGLKFAIIGTFVGDIKN